MNLKNTYFKHEDINTYLRTNSISSSIAWTSYNLENLLATETLNK